MVRSYFSMLAAILALVLLRVAVADVKIGLSAASDANNAGTYIWALAFSEALENGGMETSIFTSSSLGNEVVRAEQVLLGLLEVNVCGTQEFEPFTDMIAAMELPFMFEDSNELDRLIDETDFLARVNEIAADYGMRMIDLAYLGGMSGLFTAREPIREVSDVKSFRMRAMVSEQVGYFEAWGGAATQVAWEEVPQALQTGIVDGYMNPPIVAVLFGHGGQLDYFTDIRMSPSTRVISVSESWYQSLDDVERSTVRHAFKVARLANREWAAHSEERDFRLLDEAGIEVIHLSPAVRDEFRQKILPLYEHQATPNALHVMQGYIDTLRGTE